MESVEVTYQISSPSVAGAFQTIKNVHLSRSKVLESKTRNMKLHVRPVGLVSFLQFKSMHLFLTTRNASMGTDDVEKNGDSGHARQLIHTNYQKHYPVNISPSLGYQKSSPVHISTSLAYQIGSPVNISTTPKGRKAAQGLSFARANVNLRF
jgi:hypothetical protein